MLDLLGKGTDRGYSMIGVGLSAGLSGSRRARTVQDPLPALDLDWATNRSLPASYGPTPSFSRASTGTYFDGQGVLKSAAVNGPRFNHVYNGTSWVSKGLLVEEQRTNLSQHSEDISHPYYSKLDSSITANAIAAPDGATTADKLVENTANAFHYFSSSGYMTTNQAYTCSIFAKAAERNWIKLYVWNGVSSLGAWFNLSSGTIGTTESEITASIQNVGNGWYRCFITRTVSTGLIGNGFGVVLATADNSVAYTGDGSSGVYVWGNQVEAGSFATSYIGTTSSSVVKSASVCQLAGTGFSGIWNSSEGTLVIEGDSVSSGTTPFVSFDDNTSSERIEIYGSGTDPKVLVVDGGSTQVDIDAGTISNGTAFKLAFAYKLNDFAVSLNGGAVATGTSGTLPTVDRLRIGSNQAGNYLNGHIARLRYYPTRLTNAKLQELST